MAEDRIASILERLDAPAEPRAEFAEELLERLLDDLGAEPEPRPRPATGRARRPVSRRRLVAAFAVAAVLLAGIVVMVPRPPSAWAVIQQARERFQRLPAFHAVLDIRVNDDASDPAFEIALARELWFRSDRVWRWEVLDSNDHGFGEPGEFSVADGVLEARFVPSRNVFEARPIEEVPSLLSASALTELSPQAAYEAAGRTGVSPEDFFRERCDASEATYLGRRTHLLTCVDGNRRLELHVDQETGLLLRVEDIDVVREVRRIDVGASLEPDLFDASAPDGARTRWVGSGPPPPEFARTRDRGDTRPLTIGPSSGFSIEAATAEALWLLHYAPETLETSIVRVDPSTGERSATPIRNGRFADLEASDDSIWVSYQTGEAAPRLRLQRLDPATGTLIPPRIDIGEPGGDMAIAEGAAWVLGGRGRDLRAGSTTLRAVTVSRVDLDTFEVERFALPGLPLAIAYDAGSLWASLETVNDTARTDDNYAIVRVDPTTFEVLAEIPVPSFPNALTAGAGAVWATVGDTGRLLRIDADTLETTGAKLGGGDIAIADGSVWIARSDRDDVVRLDPSDLTMLERVTTGRGPGSVHPGDGAVWVGNVLDGTVSRIDVGEGG